MWKGIKLEWNEKSHKSFCLPKSCTYLACWLSPSWNSRDWTSSSEAQSRTLVFSVFGAWVFHKTHSCKCTKPSPLRFVSIPHWSHQISPRQGKMSLERWAHARDVSSEPCARELTQTRCKRIISTWASAVVWLIHSSRFQFNLQYDQEEKMREAPIVQTVPRLGDHRETSPSAYVRRKVINVIGGKKITHLPKSAGKGTST